MTTTDHDPAPRKRATRADVAQLANVSTAVVSYVINNGPRAVSPETAKRVREAAAKLNYRPNSIAQALRKGSSKTFGVVIPDFSNPYFAAFNSAIENLASQMGYSVLFVSSHADVKKETSCIDKLLSKDVEAIFATSAENAQYYTTRYGDECRFIVLDHDEAIPTLKCVCTDFRPMVEACVNHLLDHGHTNTAMLFGGNPAIVNTRLQGWYQAHHGHNIAPGRVVRSYYTREGAYQATMRLFQSPNPPTAIFASSDLEAFGAMRALGELGLRIPDDVAIASLDGTVDTLYANPPLTTIRQDTEAIARQAIAAALHPDDVPDVQRIPAELVIRRSCGC